MPAFLHSPCIVQAAVPTLTTLASQSGALQSLAGLNKCDLAQSVHDKGKSTLSPLPVEKSMETLLLLEPYPCVVPICKQICF